MATVLRKPLAEEDLIEIWCFVARDSLDAADTLLDSFDATCNTISESPKIGRSRKDLAPNLFSFPVGSYVIFYKEIKGGIEIIRILHGSRDIQGDFF